jgi:nucleoside-diphosphate-sugar epimerase
MKVFVTGATGFVGSAIVQELLEAGHQVLGLVRSDASAATLAAMGAEVHRGTLEDLESLKRGAAASDGVIHTAFNHDFADMAAAGKADHLAIQALGTALEGSDRPLIVTSGMAGLDPDRITTEDDEPNPNTSTTHRTASDLTTLGLARRGVRSMLLRLPPSVHDIGDYGFVPRIIKTAREKGVSAYIGDGHNRWSAVHRRDAAHLYRLALEHGSAGMRYHAIGDEGVPIKDIAEVIGKHLNLPVVSKSLAEASEHFGFLAYFLAADISVSSALTRERLGWTPTHLNLLSDLERHYFQ